MPFVKPYMYETNDDLKEENDHNIWLSGIEIEYVSALRLSLTDNVKTFPSQMYLHTMIDIGEKKELSIKMLKPALKHIQECNLETEGYILGELLIRVHENGIWHRYMDIIIPIKKD